MGVPLEGYVLATDLRPEELERLIQRTQFVHLHRAYPMLSGGAW
jgi:hypothetical protein